MDKRFQLAPVCLRTGACPRGAHVRRTTGWWERPLSSSKTSQARRRRAFFYPPPARALPRGDRGLVAFSRLPRRALDRPIQRAEQVPHVPRMKPLAREARNHGRHAGQGPEIRREAMRGGALEQGPFDPRQGGAVQARLPARAAGPFEPAPTSGSPRVKPPMRSGDAYSQFAGDCVLRQATAKQLCRLESPRFQRGEVPPTPACSGHASRSHRSS
jgi:hypothetical protein